MDYMKAGIKQDALRTAPLHMSALFPEHLISKEEEEIHHHEYKRSAGPSNKNLNVFTFTVNLVDSNWNLTGSPVHLPGNS